MTTPTDGRGPGEREAELTRLWRRMAKAMRGGDTGRYAELRAEHDRLKAEHVERSHAEQREAARERARVRLAALRAQEAQAAREREVRWRLPRGFGVSPLAAARARGAGRDVGGLVPDSRRPALSPWRGGVSATSVIWEPGRRR